MAEIVHKSAGGVIAPDGLQNHIWGRGGKRGYGWREVRIRGSGEGGDGSGDKDALAVGGKRDVENGVFKGTERGHMDAIVRPQVDLAAVRGGDEIFTIRLNGRGRKGYTLQSMHVMSLCSDGSVGRFRTGPARISVVSTPEESTEMSSQRRMVESPDL